MNCFRQDNQDLPRSIHEMADVIGFLAVCALVESFGGLTIEIPSKGTVSSQRRARLLAVLGFEATEKLITDYEGERVFIPRCVRAFRGQRDREIIAAYEAGQSVNVLARTYRMTDRNVRHILKRAPKPSHFSAKAMP